MTDYFPFYALGLRCNPFRALTDEEWAAVAVLPPDDLRQLAAGAHHTQVLGPAGHGKTTMLLSLAAHLRATGRPARYEYLPPDQAAFHTPLAELDVFLLDEAQRLAPRERQRLLRAAGAAGARLVVSSHADLSPLFRRHGLALDTVQLQGAPAAHWQAVFARRLEFFAVEGGARVWLAPEAVRWLHAACHGDLRRAEHWLYEVLQARPAPGPISAAVVRQHAPP